jgi:hypothetical protein
MAEAQEVQRNHSDTGDKEEHRGPRIGGIYLGLTGFS